MKRHWHWIALAFLWLFHTVNNWFWLAANVVSTGWDRPKHLSQSLAYTNTFNHLGLVSGLKAVIFDNKSPYPPLFHISAVPFQMVFGMSEDVAVMVNAFYMAVLLLAVYGIGRKLYDGSAGLLASVLLSLFPMAFSMPRYFFVDYALMSSVTLSIYLLLLTNGFQSKRYSFLFGISFGLGMLIKWSFIVFLLAPLCFVVLKSPVIKDIRQKLRAPRLNWRWLSISTVIGLLLTLLWYLPNKGEVSELVLDGWLFPLSWILISVGLYLITRQSSHATNFVGAFWLATLVASIWYLPCIDFLQDAFPWAYGGRGDSPNFLRFHTYFFYLEALVKEQLSLPFFVAFTLAALRIGSHALNKPRMFRNWKQAGASGWILLLWLVVPFVIFTLSTYRDSRGIMPVLPSLAIVLAHGLLALRKKLIRIAMISLLTLFGIVQFFVLSNDALAWIPSRTEAVLPRGGSFNLFAQGGHIQWPNSGINDSRYWVMPDLFDFVTKDWKKHNDKPIKFGLLINNRQINKRNVQYLISAQYPGVELHFLDEYYNKLPIYPRFFSCDYIAFMTSSRRRVASDPAQDVIRTITSTLPRSFSETFQLLKIYPLPDGERIFLYRNSTGKVPDVFPAELLFPIEHIEQVNLSDKILFLGYDLDSGWVVSDGKVILTLYWLALEPMEADYTVYLKLINAVYHVWGEQEARPYWDGLPTNTWHKGQMIGDIREIDLLPGTPPGSYQITVNLYDPYRGEELKPERDLILGPVDVPRREPPPINALDIDHPSEVNLGGKVRLLGYSLQSGFRPGEDIHLTLFWQALAKMDQNYTVFTHLVDGEGRLWGQKDNPPVDGFYPTSQWEEGEIVRDQYDIPISPDAPPGEYQLEVGMYLAETGERLPVFDGEGQALGDKILLETMISVE